MRGAVSIAVLLLAGAILLPTTVHAAPPASAATAVVAPRCAASIEEAARGIVGGAAGSAENGYRVQDLVVDAVLRKAWVRVADCRDARKPLTLVPLIASIAGDSSRAIQVSGPTSVPQAQPGMASPFAAAPSLPAAPVLIARGDAVEVLVQSASVHMTLHGHANTAASSGETLDIVLDSAPPQPGEPFEPARHMSGIATAAHRAEVRR